MYARLTCLSRNPIQKGHRKYLNEIGVHGPEITLPEIRDEFLLFIRHVVAPISKEVLVEGVFCCVVMLRERDSVISSKI